MFWFWIILTMGLSGAVINNMKTEVVKKVRGNSFTLHTDVTDYHMIIWKFGPQDSPIAQCRDTSCKISERFRDTLQIDKATGSLTITDLRDELAGKFTLQFIDTKYKSQDLKKYTVIIFDPLPFPKIVHNSERSSCPRCVLICSAMNLSDTTLSWYKNSGLISSISVSPLNTSITLDLNDQDFSEYSCVVKNSISEQRKQINISELCQTCSGLHPGLKALITVTVLLILSAVGAVSYRFWRRKIQGKEKVEKEEKKKKKIKDEEADEEEFLYNEHL